VGDSVGDSVWASVGNNSVLRMDLIYGQHDASWLGLYDYFIEACNVSGCERLLPLMEISKNCGWWTPYENLVILQEKTSLVKLGDLGVLHCEDGPALAYSDGFEIYSLNGIRVPKEIVTTPANKIDCGLILKEKNVEIRREIVRKIGIDRILKSLRAKTLDTWQNYELLNLNLGDGRSRPYLKMINPSIDTVHIEGVPLEISTVAQALAWRNGLNDKYVEPETLT